MALASDVPVSGGNSPQADKSYFWLFENASQAIVAFEPGVGRITDANRQAEKLLGRTREVLLGSALEELFAPEHREQVEWLVSRPAGHDSVALEGMHLRGPQEEAHAPALAVSCTWLLGGGKPVAQILLKNPAPINGDREALRDHADQLEARFLERTAQLQASEERFRTLFLQEQRRARHLSLINEVQKCALATRDTESFLPQVTRAVHSHFVECDVAFYLAEADRYGLAMLWPTPEESDGDMTLVAAAGRGALNPAIGSRASLARLGADSGPGAFHEEAQSYLSIPVVVDRETIGLITVQSRQPEVLDARDVAALQTSAAIIASHLQSSRMFRNMRELNDFNQGLLNSMLHSLLVVDRKGRIQFVNERLCQTFDRSRDSLLKQDIGQIFNEGLLRHHHIREAAVQVMDTGEGREEEEVHVRTGDKSLIFDFRIFRVFFRGEAEAAVLMINLTQRWRQTYQLQLMHEIGGLFQESLDIDRVLAAVLTCITAGSALGFNRAFVFLHDDATQFFTGAMALGPSSREEAGHIWSEISQHELTLAEILEQVEKRTSAAPTPLQIQTSALKVRQDNPCLPALSKALRDKTSLVATREEFLNMGAEATEEQRADGQLAAQLFTAGQLAIAPLVAKDKLVGVVVADNLYSGTYIDHDSIQLLDTLAKQAALTIDNALTYQALQDAQRELVSAERLVAVGEMAARVSHEIRNPLATIGGFARSVLKKPEDTESVIRKVNVVVNEIARLEELLNDLLDMARPRALVMEPHSVNDIVEHALLLADADIKAAGAVVEKDLEPDLPRVHCDRSRLLQALLNTIRNGAQAMPDGGALVIGTRAVEKSGSSPAMVQIWVKDSGTGISERALKQVFDPFFSTKVSGSGLGLAVTKRIIQDHGGHIDVASDEGQGTTFIFSLPLPDEETEETDFP